MGQSFLSPPPQQLPPPPPLIEPSAYPEHDAYIQVKLLLICGPAFGVILCSFLMACLASGGRRTSNNNGEEEEGEEYNHDIETGSTELEERRERLALLKNVAFEKKLINGGDHDEDEDEVCPICLEILEEREECVVLPFCSHIYHYLCIQQWLLKDSHCPLCRLLVWNQ